MQILERPVIGPLYLDGDRTSERILNAKVRAFFLVNFFFLGTVYRRRERLGELAAKPPGRTYSCDPTGTSSRRLLSLTSTSRLMSLRRLTTTLWNRSTSVLGWVS